MESKLTNGTTLVIDRYSYSGVAFSAAKGLNVEWCKAPEVGLIAPDLVLYFDISPEKAAERGGYGTERYEKLEFQKKVADSYRALRDASWKVHTLLKGLEKIAVSADIPMLVCGDFNSVPGSAPYSLLATGKVDPLHPDLAIDPIGILRATNKLSHQLPLVSAYSSFARMGGVSPALEQQRRRMDPRTNEPLFTNCTRDFIGAVDYIFYTADSLVVESLLELLDEDNLRKDTAIPSPEWSSDHIALLAEFRCKPRRH